MSNTPYNTPPSFVVLEGIDGAGTTTQSKELQKRLKKRDIPYIETAEPSSGPIGRLIRQRLGQVETPPHPATMALLFAADRLDHWTEEIQPALDSGKWVISDRYVWSSLSYQSQTQPFEWVKTLNQYAPRPDLTILVDVDPSLTQERMGRAGRKKEIYDELEMQNQVRRLYMELLNKEGTDRAVLVDGNGPIDEVAELIWKHVSAHL